MNSLMTNDNVKIFPHDKILAKTLLKLIPQEVYPNHLTVLRVLMTPVILYFLWSEKWSVVVPLFLAAALTDLLDGSLARTRKRITTWGTVADPIADKLLIGSVMILFVAREINVYFAALTVFVEVAIATTALVRRLRGQPYISANWYGKIKMLFQVIGVSTLLIARWSGVDMFVPFSIGTLSIAVVFALMSLYTYGL
jgi:CDP-diacylglycerol--glycerol-3-phosphate 3-phosphatidyltransferase